ncbi:MAG: FAD:protein FMN transferase [Planctomycetota bacterium]
MRARALACLAVCAALWLWWRSGSQSAPSIVSLDLGGEVMGTKWHLRCVAAGSREAALRVAVQAALDDVDRRFSTYRSDSLISRFNAHRSTEPFAVDADFVALLALGLELAAATEGAFDPTIFPVVRLLGFAGGTRSEPTPAAMAEALASVGWRKVEVLAEQRVAKSDPRVEIDLSAIAKGHAVDRGSQALAALGVVDHMLEVGGEVVCRGSRPDGGPWRIGVERPDPDAATGGGPIHRVVVLADRALATSGSYRNYFDSGGRRRHHIVDARSGQNVETRVVSASVIAADCALADGLATALMLVGPEGAQGLRTRWPNRVGGVLFLLAEPSGGISEFALDWPNDG